MNPKMKWAAILILFFGLAVFGIKMVAGAGAFKRHIVMTGVYSICRPDGYPVVCFLDADGKDGGMFCLPLSLIGNKCKGEK